VEASISISSASGLTAASFGSTAARNAFSSALAATLSRNYADVSIVAVTDLPPARRALRAARAGGAGSAGVAVAFRVRAASDVDAGVVSAAIVAPSALTVLASVLAAQGGTFAAVTPEAMHVAKQPTAMLAGAAAAAPPPPPPPAPTSAAAPHAARAARATAAAALCVTLAAALA
jgi:hypothetical protein